MSSPFLSNDDMARRLRSIQCTCSPVQWREGEADYVCFCKFIEINGLIDVDDTPRERRSSPPSSDTETYDVEAYDDASESITAPHCFDGPSIQSELPLPQAVTITQDLSRTARAMRRSDQRLIRAHTKIKSEQDEILRRLVLARIAEMARGNHDWFCFSVAGKWYEYRQATLEIF